MRRLVRGVLLAALITTLCAGPALATQYGAYDVHGAIEAKYLVKCGPSGVLGLPVTNELPTPDGVGRYNHFQLGGSIYWNPYLGAYEVHGAIYSTWAGLRWETGILGYPITDETSTPYVYGRYNAFQYGSIYWSPSTGAHEVYGAIRDKWSQMGWENSPLGFPISGEYDIPGGRRNDFQGGNISWTPAGGAIASVTSGVSNGPAVPIAPCAPPPPPPPPPGTIVLSGTGTQVVNVNKPAGPMLVEVQTVGPATSSYLGVYSAAGGQLLANELGAVDVVAPLDWRVFGTSPQTTQFQVTADPESLGWRLTLNPLSAVGRFDRGVTIGESRGTIWRYVGPAGVAHITSSGSGYFGVTAYYSDTSYSDLLANEIGRVDLTVPIAADQYLVIQTDTGSGWTISVS